MDKVKLEFKLPIKKTIEYYGTAIEVDPYLTMVKQIFLIQNYIKDLFSKEEEGDIAQYPYLVAEFNLKNYILQICTNVDTNEMDNDIYVDSNFWKKLFDEIINYKEFRSNLDIIVEQKIKEVEFEHSSNRLVENILNKVASFLDEMSKITPEQIESLQKTGIELAKTLEKNSVLTQPTKKTTRKKSNNVGEA